MTDFFRNIYQHQADEYHQLISHEDIKQQLLPAIEQIVPITGKRVLDLGSGTGRFSLAFAPHAADLVALDLHMGMLQEQRQQRDKQHGRWPLLQGDMRTLPFCDHWADVVTVGWAMGHFQAWFAPDWQPEVDRALQEMLRVLKPEGTLIIVETMGTGTDAAGPPTAGLAAYYAYIEETWGFKRQVVVTDMLFESVEATVKHAGFFFPALVDKIRQNSWRRLPEWTGIWHRPQSNEQNTLLPSPN